MVELSVIIPTFNRASHIRACLDAIAHQTLPPSDFEVIVVVDGSTDETAAMLAHYESPFLLHVEVQANQGPSRARNRGIELAVGAYCLFLDDDIIADPGLFAAHLLVQRQHHGVIGLGHLHCRLPRRSDGFARAVAAWWADHYDRLRSGTRPASFADCFSGNLSAPRSALVAAGGFATDVRRSEDVELGYRLVQDGLEVVYIPEAVARQHYDKRFREIVNDAAGEGRASLDLYRRHPPILPALLLGQFVEAPPRIVMLRRIMLALDVPIGPLKLASRILDRTRLCRRWYSFLYDYVYWRAVHGSVRDRDTWQRLTHAPVILMYHAFGAADEAPSRYVVPARSFARQLAWLKWRGYRVIRLGDLLRLRREYRLPPAHTVVITIDDGYADAYTIAYPLLRHFGLPATFFVVSGFIGDQNRWDRTGALVSRPTMGWPAIRELCRSGMEIGAHTRSHRPLPDVPAGEIDDEVNGSRADLAHGLGRPVTAFAYPYGAHDGAIQASVERAGYNGACGARDGINGAATPSFALHRIEVVVTDSLVRFALAVWLGSPLRHVRWPVRSGVPR